MDFYPFYFSTDFYSTTLHLAKNSIFYRSFIPTFQRSFLYPRLPVAKSERIHVRSKARPSMTHDIIGSPCHPGSSTAPCEIQFLRVQSIESIRHFVLFRYKTVHGGFFFSSLSLFPQVVHRCEPCSNCRDPDPGKKLLKFRFLSDLSPRKFNRILFRFEWFTCDTSVRIVIELRVDSSGERFSRYRTYLSLFYFIIWNSWSLLLLSKNLV